MKKKNNKGFIATSLIYSFFLVFLALLLAILSTYLTTSRVLNTYNKGVKNKLNALTNIPEIYPLNQECFVKEAESNSILNTCFKTYNMISNPVIGDDYICAYANNITHTIYNTENLSASSDAYFITCKVRNKGIDERYLSSATVSLYVVNEIS